MQVEQITWSERGGWQRPPAAANAQMVMAFGHRSAFVDSAFTSGLASHWPNAARIGCSTAGQILGTDVSDEGAVVTAVHFDHTDVRVATAHVTAAESAAAGASRPVQTM